MPKQADIVQQKVSFKVTPYFDGINALTADNVSKPQELLHSENARSPQIGNIEKREGYSIVGTAAAGATFVATGNYGLFFFNGVVSGTNNGMYRISAVVPSPTVCNIYYLNNSNVWTILSGGGININIGTFDYTVAEQDTYLVNYTDKNRYILGSDGTTVVDSSSAVGNLYHSPKAAKINYYKNRLYIANYISDDNATIYPTSIMRSTPPVGILSLVNGDPVSPYGEIDVTDTNYIYNIPWTTNTTSVTNGWNSIVSNIAGDKVVATTDGGYIYLSTNYGATWTALTTSGQRSWVSICASDDLSIIAAAVGGGYIYVSTNTGATWTQVATSQSWLKISCDSAGINMLAVNTIIDGTTVTPGSIVYSTNSGSTWASSTLAPYINGYSFDDIVLSRTGNYAYAACSNRPVQYSTNKGLNWSALSNSPASGTNIVICDSSGKTIVTTVYNGELSVSSNYGVDWTTNTTFGVRPWLRMSGNTDLSVIVVTMQDFSVWLSTNYASSFLQINDLPGYLYYVYVSLYASIIYLASYSSPYSIYTLQPTSSNSNLLDVYRGNQKIATVRVISVTETSVNVYSISWTPGNSTIFSADELWAYNTFTGKKQFRWANNPTTGGLNVKEYDTFKLTSPDDSGITLLTNIANMMIIANKSAVAAWNDYVLTNFDVGVGCVSPRGYVKAMGTLFFVHYAGIFATTGSVPQLISSKVEPYFNGATKSGLENCCAGKKGRSIFFHIGTVTLYKLDGSVRRTLTDVVLEYSVTQQNWFVHTGISAQEFNNYIESTNADRLLFTSSETNYPVGEFLNGSTDNGREIPMRADLHYSLLPGSLENIAYPTDIITEAERGKSTHVFISLDQDDYYELEGTVGKGLSIMKLHGPEGPGDVMDGTLTRCRRISVSYRDNSKQRCKLTMNAIKYIDSPEIENIKPNA